MNHPIRIAIASGKGGTGKTTFATNLAVVSALRGAPTVYLDCDVEEPNGHIFLSPAPVASFDVTVPIPAVETERCTLCGECGNACQYSAIAVLPNRVLTFPALCHGCGACSLVCPERAIREVDRVTGVVRTGRSGDLLVVEGRLNIGEAMAPPVIRAVLRAAPPDHVWFIDAPPGTSCPVIESVKTADAVVLVTEPTPFGLHDLKLAVAMVRELGLPFGVVINRAGVGDDRVGEYCRAERIPVLMELPNDRRIAEAYSRGELLVRGLPEYQSRFSDLLHELAHLVRDPRPRKERSMTVLRESLPEPPDDPLPLGRKRGLPELVVISGKGGTGKTSIVASFHALAKASAVADCDVDASDLHLVLRPEVKEEHPFLGGKVASIDPARCTACGICEEHCRFGAISPCADPGSVCVDPVSCEGCGVCALVCPEHAVDLARSVNGAWFVSKTRGGPMVHARLGIAQENSGKLVSLVRKHAKTEALKSDSARLIVDGSPGIGCPVIASITGARLVLVVTEPTLSGFHDLERVVALTRQFNVPCAVCINKHDINPDLSERIERRAAELGVPVCARVRYDDAFTHAQIQETSIVELGDGPAARDIEVLWARVEQLMT